MPAAPQPAARRLRHLYALLLTAYGPQSWWPAKTRFEVIVGAYLTQNTSWQAVERSLANLRARRLLSVRGIRSVQEEELRELIRPSGSMTRKAASLKAFVAFLDANHSGSLRRMAAVPTDELRPQVLALPGVGPETADAILLYALDHPVMVVDEYLRRVVSRHQLLPGTARYLELQQLATEAFAQDASHTHLQHFNEFHALIVEVGKRHCRKTPLCHGCPLDCDPHIPDLEHH